MKISLNQKGFGVIEGLLVVIAVTLIVGVGFYVVNTNKSDNSTKTTSSTSKSSNSKPAVSAAKTHNSQEAVAFTQKTYDDYLVAVNKANSDSSNTQPVAQVGLSAVKANLSADLYAKAAAVTQATPFSCTAQYVAGSYKASLGSSDKTSATVTLSISNGSDTSTSGMSVMVDLATLRITSVTCPS